jgi:hypothetical protein
VYGIGSAAKAQKKRLPKPFFSLSSHNHYPFRNSLSPRNINIATTQYNDQVGATTQPSQKEKRQRKKKKNKCQPQ